MPTRCRKTSVPMVRVDGKWKISIADWVKDIKPEEVEAHFGWLALFAGLDMPSSGALTQKKLNWKPAGPGLIADLDGMDYTQA